MAGTQALDASRAPAFTFKPQDLTLVSAQGERFYSPTVEDPIDDLRVLDVASRGVKLSILVRRDKVNGRSVVVDGRNRVKLALVVNALTGVCPYTGNLYSVLEAIKRLKDSDIGRRIVELALTWGAEGVMLKAFADNGGSDLDAEANGIATDEMRRGGAGCTWDVRAKRAQQLIEAGQPIESVAANMNGVTVATLKRWIAKLNAGETLQPKKVRTASSRPKTKDLKRLFKNAGQVSGLTPRERTLIYFVMGVTNEETLLAAVPELAQTDPGSEDEEPAGGD